MSSESFLGWGTATHLLAEHCRPAQIYAEDVARPLNDRRARSRSFLARPDASDRETSRVVGYQWDPADEEELMARAERARQGRSDAS